LTDLIKYSTFNSYRLGSHLCINIEKETIMAVDDMISAIEDKYEVLRSNVPGSRLHEIINNPVDEGIDGG